MEAEITLWIAAFSYPAVFLLLVLGGVGAPVSEELVIITGGLVAARNGASLPMMMLTVWLGILAGDSALYRMGRLLGPRVFTHPRMARVLTPARLVLLRRLFTRRGVQAVLLARFLPGLRAPAFLMAGASGLSYRRFLLADGVAAWAAALGMTWLGYRFGNSVLEQVRGSLRWGVLAVGVAGALLLLVRRLRRRTPERGRVPLPEGEPRGGGGV
ncbi:MAG TPA: DedA family protein [Myxococcaceae bacterium]|nr:DedA family protein [Myxococcaceae bacterium]